MKNLRFFTLSEALRPRDSVKNTVFCSCLERKPCPKPSLDGDQYSLTVKQVSTFCPFPAVKNVEKHSVFSFQCLRKTGPKLGPMLWEEAAHYGLTHMGERKSAAQAGTPVRIRGGVNPGPFGPFKQPQSMAAAALLIFTCMF